MAKRTQVEEPVDFQLSLLLCFRVRLHVACVAFPVFFTMQEIECFRLCSAVMIIL